MPPQHPPRAQPLGRLPPPPRNSSPAVWSAATAPTPRATCAVTSARSSRKNKRPPPRLTTLTWPSPACKPPSPLFKTMSLTATLPPTTALGPILSFRPPPPSRLPPVHPAVVVTPPPRPPRRRHLSRPVPPPPRSPLLLPLLLESHYLSSPLPPPFPLTMAPLAR